MKLFLKILAVLAALIIIFVLFVEFTWDKPLNAPYPDITASTDSAVIARGEYLVYGPAHCFGCHISADAKKAGTIDMTAALSGGSVFDFPPAVIPVPNITPDMETGIGRLTDAEIARTLRYAVGSDGRYIVPHFMPFQETSDEDLKAIISYLRSTKPVKHEVPAPEYRFLGKALMALGVLPVRDTTLAGPKSIKKDSSAVYGEYIARAIGNCYTCHTNIDVMTIKPLGEPFSGGFYMEPEKEGGHAYVSPNLTPDPETGHIAQWDQAMFIRRFRAGRVYEDSPMPWEAFSRMDDVELIALYKFLRSLPAVHHKIDKIVYAPGEEYTAH
jgi:mono/diheme cytochrome c family protein